MKKLYISLLIIIVLAVGAIIGVKIWPHGEPVKTFTDSTGSYSLSYPAQFAVIEKDSKAIITTTDEAAKPVLSIEPIIYRGYMEFVTKYTNAPLASRKIGSYTVYILQTNSQKAYIIPLDVGTAPGSFIVISKDVADPAGLTGSQIDSLIASIKIDDENFASHIKDQLEIAKVKGTEARMRAMLSQIRMEAEIYYGDSKSYAGLCSPADIKGARHNLLALFSEITTYVGKSNLLCFAQKAAYAVSAKFPSGTIICADSDGYFNEPKTMITGPSCK